MYEHLQPDPPDSTTIEGLNEHHARGEVPDAVYNRRRDVLLREEADIGTYRWLQEIDGVGPVTAFRLADRFETMTDVRAAQRREFEAVHNVGESIVGAIEAKREDEHRFTTPNPDSCNAETSSKPVAQPQPHRCSSTASASTSIACSATAASVGSSAARNPPR